MIWFLGALVALVGVAGSLVILRRNKRMVHPTPESLVIRLEDDIPDRFIELEGVVNFRDVGGYKTADGQRVRRGLVFRSGGLMHLTDADMARLDVIGFKLICDLRGKEEIAEQPDRLPTNPAPEYLHLPLTVQDDRRRRLWALMSGPQSILPMLPEMYTRTMIDGNAKLYGGLLRRLAEPDNLPTLIHCTAGKDRTGVAVALLLLLLGVPDEVVVADYSLSNLYFDTFFEYGKRVAHSLRWFGVRAEDLSPLFMANPETLRITIAHIRTQYGSVESYLRDATGLDNAAITALRTNLLEEVESEK
jgi:protein-tyrosine phosphatase